MARRGQTLTISLFSFQDIITSVSAILIFITLMLALELIQSVEGSPANRVARDLDAAAAQAESERDALREAIRRAANDLVLALEDGSSDSLASREEVEAASQSLKGEVEGLEVRNADAQVRMDRVRAREFAARDDEARKDRAREETKKILEEIQREKSEDRVYYTAGENGGRERWIVVLGGDRIATSPIGRAQRPTVFLGEDDDTDVALRRFLAWTRTDAPDVYFLLLVRPSGCKRFDKVEIAFREARRNFGFDLVGETKKVLDDERGAGFP